MKEGWGCHLLPTSRELLVDSQYHNSQVDGEAKGQAVGGREGWRTGYLGELMHSAVYTIPRTGYHLLVESLALFERPSRNHLELGLPIAKLQWHSLSLESGPAAHTLRVVQLGRQLG